MKCLRLPYQPIGIVLAGAIMVTGCRSEPLGSSSPDVQSSAIRDAGIATPSVPVDAGERSTIDSGASVDASAQSGHDSGTISNVGQIGLNSLFIGHSFFIPVARGAVAHIERAGIEGHQQRTVFSGGATGAPQALWNNANKSALIKSILDQGDIELLGMTYHPNYPALTGYTNWIDYALERNPNVTVFIGLPWQPEPTRYDSDTYAAAWETGHPEIAHGHIDALRERYPGLTIFCIPYGAAAVALRQRLANNDLPDVERIQTNANGRGIFRDRLGHGEPILLDLSRLIWLRAIYGVDLVEYDDDLEYETDLSAIATDIMAGHSPEYRRHP